MTDVVEIRGLREIISRMSAYPEKLRQQMKLGMNATLLILWEKVPPYPPPPPDSSYRRTGTLGRTLGATMNGGKSGAKPSIYQTKKIGQGYEGRFGTNLGYAPYVIGEGTQSSTHKGRWWTLKDVAKAATEKMLKVWEGIGRNMARFLEGKGL